MTDDLRRRLRDASRWGPLGVDHSGWWGDPALLSALAVGLAELHPDARIDAVAAPATRGFILGPLVAQQLGVGFVELRKDQRGDPDGKELLRRSAPPDWQRRDLTLTLQRGALRPRDRVLFVDDWIASRAQARAAAEL